MITETPLATWSPRFLGRRIRWNRSIIAAAALLLVIVIPCVLAPLFARYSPIEQLDIIGLRTQPPSALHPFGTDYYSRDVLSRVLYGGRLSLSIALVATLVSVTLGTAYGAIAGYAGGMVETVMMRILDALLSIPRLLLLIAIFAAWQQVPIEWFVVIVGFTGWYGLSRIVRGQVLAIKHEDYVVSARALGAGRRRIVLRHILPNLLTPIIVATALGVGHVILLETGLSYLGVGVPVPQASWGSIIQDGAENITTYWWISFFPGMAIVLTVMAFNALGDAFREALQPKGAQS
ncbi:MAG TPA: ABC transporter permease [Gemmatimonadaceae bacterium]|nr:ABC transporter permease [Gemmatimonadaceae bacterium]